MDELYRVVLGAKLEDGAKEVIQKQVDGITKALKPIEIKTKIDTKELENMNSLLKSVTQVSKALDNIAEKQDKYNQAMQRANKAAQELSRTEQQRIAATIKRQKTAMLDFQRTRGIDMGRAGAQDEFNKLLRQLDELSTRSPKTRADLQTISAGFAELKLKVNESSDAIGKVTKDTAFKIETFQKDMNHNLDKLTDRLGKKANIDAIEQMRMKINALSADMKNPERAMKSLRQEIRQFTYEQQEAANYAGFFGDALNNVGKRIVSYVGVVLSTRAIMNAVRDGVSTVREMDVSLTEIAMVTNQTREQVKGLGSEFNQLAKDMGVATSALTQGAVTFYRQGLETEDVMKRLEAATVYSKVANMDFNDSVEIITASVNSMGIEAERVVDVLVYMGDATATSGEEVGKGFARTSGSAKAMGLEFEKVASWIATISAKTREDAGSIGSAINTIITRMANMKEKGFDEEDGTQINEVAKALKQVDIELMNMKTGEWRDFGAIMDELGAKWETLDGKTKSYIATTMAGTRRQSQFYNLMEGYAESVELYEGAMDAAGTASRKFDTYLESNQAKADTFKATVEGIWIEILDSDTLGKIIEGATNAVIVLDELIKLVAKLDTNIIKIISTLTLLRGVLLGLGKIGKVADLSGKGILGMVSALWKANPLLLAIPAVVGGAVYAFGKWTLATKEQEEALRNMGDMVSKTTSEVSNMDDLIQRYETLTEKGKEDAEARKELLELQKQLAQQYPELVTNMDAEGNKLVDNIALLKEYRDVTHESMMAQLEAANQLSSERIPELDREMEQIANRIEEIQNILSTTGVEDTSITIYTEMGTQIKETSKNAEELKAELQGLLEKQTELSAEKQQSENISEMYNEQLRVQAENAKWAKAEEIALALQHATTEQEVVALTKSLVELGFTSEQIAKIRAGGLDEVRAATEILTAAEKDEIRVLTEIEATAKQTYITRLQNEINLTKQSIALIKQRIEARQAELRVMAGVAGTNIDMTSPDAMLKSGAADKIGGLSLSERKKAQRKYDYNKQNIAELKELNALIEDNQNLINNISSLPVVSAPGVFSAGPGSGKDKKKKKSGKKEYRALFDMYMEINKLIDDNSAALERNSLLQENNQLTLKDSTKLVEEELQLRRQRQDLMHSQAQLLRAEQKQLEGQLSKQGFAFAGQGDKRYITNLQNIAGKTKEVEESVQRYIEITSKELPKSSNAWWELENTIRQLKIDKITAQFYKMGLNIEEGERKTRELEHQLSMLGDTDANKSMDLIAEQYEIAASNADRYALQLQILDTLQADDKNTQAYIDKKEEISAAFRKAELDAKKYLEAIKAIEDNEKTKYMQEQNKLYDEQQKKLKALESIQETIVAIIKKRGEEERRILDENYKKDMEQLKERHDKRKENYNDELDAYKKMIQAKLDALEEQYDEEDYQEKLNEEKQKAIELQEKINILSLDDSLEGRNQTLKAQEELAKQQAKIDKMQTDRERKLYKQSLQDRLKDKEDELKDKDDLANDYYESEKKKLEEDYEINKALLDKKYSDAEIYKEAREALLNGYIKNVEGGFDDIYDAYVRFEDEFGKGMGILGDHIKNDFMAELENATEAIDRFFIKSEQLVKKINSIDEVTNEQAGITHSADYGKNLKKHPDFSNWSDDDYAEYVQNKAMWATASNEEKVAYEMRNAMLRQKHGMKADKHSLKDLIAHYDTGGFIPKDGVIMAHEAELYVPLKEQRALWEFLQSLPNFMSRNTVNMAQLPSKSSKEIGGDKYVFNITGVDEGMVPRLKTMIRDAVEEAENRKVINLMKKGV